MKNKKTIFLITAILVIAAVLIYKPKVDDSIPPSIDIKLGAKLQGMIEGSRFQRLATWSKADEEAYKKGWEASGKEEKKLEGMKLHTLYTSSDTTAEEIARKIDLFKDITSNNIGLVLLTYDDNKWLMIPDLGFKEDEQGNPIVSYNVDQANELKIKANHGYFIWLSDNTTSYDLNLASDRHYGDLAEFNIGWTITAIDNTDTDTDKFTYVTDIWEYDLTAPKLFKEVELQSIKSNVIWVNNKGYQACEDVDNDKTCDDVDDCVGEYDIIDVCNGTCDEDVDNDGTCDPVDDCVGEYDIIGVCNGTCDEDKDEDDICDDEDTCVGIDNFGPEGEGADGICDADQCLETEVKEFPALDDNFTCNEDNSKEEVKAFLKLLAADYATPGQGTAFINYIEEFQNVDVNLRNISRNINIFATLIEKISILLELVSEGHAIETYNTYIDLLEALKTKYEPDNASSLMEELNAFYNFVDSNKVETAATMNEEFDRLTKEINDLETFLNVDGVIIGLLSNMDIIFDENNYYTISEASAILDNLQNDTFDGDENENTISSEEDGFVDTQLVKQAKFNYFSALLKEVAKLLRGDEDYEFNMSFFLKSKLKNIANGEPNAETEYAAQETFVKSIFDLIADFIKLIHERDSIKLIRELYVDMGFGLASLEDINTKNACLQALINGEFTVTLDEDKDGKDDESVEDICFGDDALDSDGDGYCDNLDFLKNDASEWLDTDKDGKGDNIDADDDGDGIPDEDEEPNEDTSLYLITLENSELGCFSNYLVNLIMELIPKKDSDGDGVADSEDAFGNDPTEQYDADGDGQGDKADTDDDNDDTPDEDDDDIDGDEEPNDTDAFPQDPKEWEDTDGDGVGDNSDFDPNDKNVQSKSDVKKHYVHLNFALAETNGCYYPSILSKYTEPGDYCSLEEKVNIFIRLLERLNKLIEEFNEKQNLCKAATKTVEAIEELILDLMSEYEYPKVFYTDYLDTDDNDQVNLSDTCIPMKEDSDECFYIQESIDAGIDGDYTANHKYPITPLWGTIDETDGYIYTAADNTWDAVIHALKLKESYKLISDQFIEDFNKNVEDIKGGLGDGPIQISVDFLEKGVPLNKAAFCSEPALNPDGEQLKENTKETDESGELITDENGIVQVKKYLSEYDTNSDGYLSLKELQACLVINHNLSIQCIED